jgi:hypothetical protein
MPEYDVVLGMDFLHAHHSILRIRQRNTTLTCPGGNPVTVFAFQEEPELPVIDSDTIEVCSMNAFSRMRNAADWDHANIILGSRTRDDPCCLVKVPRIQL